jgi:IS5 family transposase
MRRLFAAQYALNAPVHEHRHVQELVEIDRILRDNPGMTEAVWQGLGEGAKLEEGREGMRADQILRAAVVKQLNTATYDELSFWLLDSQSYRWFVGLEWGEAAPSRATLQRNIKSITEETWEEIHRILVGYARKEGVEDGRKVRVDGTVTETNIHHPTDSSLLSDGVRVLNRLMKRAREDFGVSRFPNRERRARRRNLDVVNAKRRRKRTKAYRNLLQATRETVRYAGEAAAELDACPDVMAWLLSLEIHRYIDLIEQVIDQTERRVLEGETVPASEKIVSLFEPHTDIIIKDNRDTHFGHKLTLSSGRSGLILDWVVEDGNPADSTLALRMLERQKEIYGRVPRQAAFDGCYASKANLAEAKALGVKDVVFSKKCGLEVLDMAKSHWVYKRLRNFRAGIESWISFLKRCFGLERCTWRGEQGFARYVGASIVAANLLTMARHLLQ